MDGLPWVTPLAGRFYCDLAARRVWVGWGVSEVLGAFVATLAVM